jgi:hypothetical protein
MNLFHGTSRSGADSIEGPPINVNVNIGGGELGRGFYLGDNMTLAISWAKGRNRQPGVLDFNIDNRQYAQLSFRQLSHTQVLNTWHQLRKLGTHRAHLFTFDVVFGSLATAPYACQYKFETNNSQTLLNNSTIQRIL